MADEGFDELHGKIQQEVIPIKKRTHPLSHLEGKDSLIS
jgi:hypothetical protein